MAEKQVLVIMGSPRKGNTYRACEVLREVVQQQIPAEFEYLWLKDANLSPCKGCLACFAYGEERCPLLDDAPAMLEMMNRADMVVFASPVYGMNVSGIFKTFIDRFSFVFHRPRFFDKKAFLLVTTGVMGEDDVLRYLDQVARIWGFEVIGRAGLVTPSGTFAGKRAEEHGWIIAKAAADIAAALQRPARASPGLMDVIVFHAQRAVFALLETESPADFQYWQEKGWLAPDARYFVDVPVNPLYTAIGRIVGWYQARRTRHDLEHSAEPA
ncbi:MAG: flavodoxin family protein [Methanomicrobiales archaeon]|nr:flavodoxin family protein [Methanomicrobiales archaeon]